MDIIIGFVMLLFFCAYGTYSLIVKDFNYDLRFLLQMLISAGGAFYILVWQNLDKIKSFFKRKEGDFVMPETEKTEPACGMGQSCLCKMLDSKDMRDYATLVYLRNRAKELNSQELLDLTVKMNALLFAGSSQQDKQ
jgi:hypothetical protein